MSEISSTQIKQNEMRKTENNTAYCETEQMGKTSCIFVQTIIKLNINCVLFYAVYFTVAMNIKRYL